jgi:hypothetical protein
MICSKIIYDLITISNEEDENFYKQLATSLNIYIVETVPKLELNTLKQLYLAILLKTYLSKLNVDIGIYSKTLEFKIEEYNKLVGFKDMFTKDIENKFKYVKLPKPREQTQESPVSKKVDVEKDLDDLF